MLTPKEVLELVYLAVFGRIPEGSGLRYWEERLNEGKGLEEVREMLKSAEGYEGFQGISQPENFVKAIYKNVLGREPDQEGLNFWTNALKEGRTNYSGLIEEVYKSATTQYETHPATKTLLNRMEAVKELKDMLPTADVNGDGVVDSNGFQIFKDLLNTINTRGEKIK